MRGRTAVLVASLVLIGLMAAATIEDMIANGFNLLLGVSFLIVVLLGFGVIGALTTPPPPDE